MKKILLALLLIASQAAFAASYEITSISATPTLQYVGGNASNGLTLQVTVGTADTCLVEFSATPNANLGGGNWQPVNTLNLITANATQNLPSGVNSVRLSRTAGANTCILDIGGVGQ